MRFEDIHVGMVVREVSCDINLIDSATLYGYYLVTAVPATIVKNPGYNIITCIGYATSEGRVFTNPKAKRRIPVTRLVPAQESIDVEMAQLEAKRLVLLKLSDSIFNTQNSFKDT